MDSSAIMVHAELGETNERLFALTGDLAVRLGASQIIGIAGCQPVQFVCDPTYDPGEIIAADRWQIEVELKEAERRFHETFRPKAKRLEWRSNVTGGSLADYIASEARSADLVITNPDIGGSAFDHTRQVKIADLVFGAGRPVLIVPKSCDHLDLSLAMVGWNDSPECRRAIVAALPLLKLAERTSVVAVTSAETKDRREEQVKDVLQWLSRHGVKAAGNIVISNGGDAACFSRRVQELAPGLIVAGAYGHSRVREWVLGGVTGDFLINPDRPVLLSH